MTIALLLPLPVLALLGLVALREARRAREASASLPLPRRLPPVSLIKPVYGVDEYSEEAFASWFAEAGSYPGEVQLIFSLQSPEDPALPLLERLGREAGVAFELLIHPVRPGWSGKTSNLAYGLERARHDVLVFSDGDIVAPRGTLARLAGQVVGGAHGPARDIVACLVRTTRGANVWARQYALFWNAGLMGIAGPALHRGVGTFLPGGTIGLTRSALEAVGGLEALREYAAEDLAMSTRAAEVGLVVGLGPTVESPIGAMGFGAYLDKMRRGHLMHLCAGYRSGAGYALAVIAGLTLPSVLLAGGLWTGNPLWLAGGLLYGAVRMLQVGRFQDLAEHARVPRRLPARPALDFPFTSACALATLATSGTRRELTWGGIRYQVGYRGRLRQVA